MVVERGAATCLDAGEPGAEDLRKAGIAALIVSPYRGGTAKFVRESIEQSHNMIVIGTESLLEKHRGGVIEVCAFVGIEKCSELCAFVGIENVFACEWLCDIVEVEYVLMSCCI